MKARKKIVIITTIEKSREFQDYVDKIGRDLPSTKYPDGTLFKDDPRTAIRLGGSGFEPTNVNQ